MNPEFAPQFALLCDRLRAVAWLSSVGRATAMLLPFPCQFVSDAASAKAAIERPEWEDWTLERGNDTALLLSRKFPRRDAAWNIVVKRAKGFLQTEIEPRLLPALASVLPDSKIAIDALRWDLVSALVEAAYADCRPPMFFTHLVTVYEAGHIPVGWDASCEPGVLLVY